MSTQPQPSIDLSPPPPSDDRELVMDRLWHRLAETFGLEVWTAARGAVGGESYHTWTDGLAGYTVDQLHRGVLQLAGWRGAKPPDLAQFSRLCLTAGPHKAAAADPSPLPAPPAASQVPAAELQRQARVACSPKSREPNAGDAESFADSYHRCGLGSRWPGGRVVGA